MNAGANDMDTSPILFIDQFASIGGGQRSLLALVDVCIEKGASVEVLAPGGGALEREIDDRSRERLRFQHLPEAGLTAGSKSWKDLFAYGFYCLRVLPRLFVSIRRSNAVCVNGPRLFLPVFCISKILKRRFIYYVRLDHSGLEKRLIRMIALSPATFRVIANSSFTASRLMEAESGLAGSSKLQVIENSIYPPYDRLPFVDRFQGGSDSMVFGIFGRVSPEKGHSMLPLLAGIFPKDIFYIVGRCRREEEPYLADILARSPERIRHIDFSRDLPRTVDDLGIQVSLVPSLWEETFGLAAVESMAMSCLTLVSSKGELPAIARKTGALCFETMENCIQHLHSIKGMTGAARSQLAQSQHEKALSAYSFEQFKGKISNLFIDSSSG
jgi:glycosyltransferase involved in cell wall biosynthesis